MHFLVEIYNQNILFYYVKVMKDIYEGFDFISAKEGGENTGNIDVTLENLRTARERKAHFAVVVSAMRKEGEFNTTQMLENIGRQIAM